eukprot:m.142098 g.142098  ORF g.142098 m.142098 type:complete len:376 (-) comp11576_c0_seq2:170-1297(-)
MAAIPQQAFRVRIPAQLAPPMPPTPLLGTAQSVSAVLTDAGFLVWPPGVLPQAVTQIQVSSYAFVRKLFDISTRPLALFGGAPTALMGASLSLLQGVVVSQDARWSLLSTMPVADIAAGLLQAHQALAPPHVILTDLPALLPPQNLNCQPAFIHLMAYVFIQSRLCNSTDLMVPSLIPAQVHLAPPTANSAATALQAFLSQPAALPIAPVVQPAPQPAAAAAAAPPPGRNLDQIRSMLAIQAAVGIDRHRLDSASFHSLVCTTLDETTEFDQEDIVPVFSAACKVWESGGTQLDIAIQSVLSQVRFRRTLSQGVLLAILEESTVPQWPEKAKALNARMKKALKIMEMDTKRRKVLAGIDTDPEARLDRLEERCHS